MYNRNNENCCMSNHGKKPCVTNIKKATMENCCFRKELWTGNNLQATLMCIPPCGEIGVECHPCLDQFLYIESGCGCVKMGCNKCNLDCQEQVGCGCAIFVPAGTWHNLVNTGNCPLKLFSIYAPTEHEPGTIHRTKADADGHGHECC